MAARSTRQKIRDQSGKMVNSCIDILVHLKNASDLADGRSEVINNFTPLIIELQDSFLKVLTDFRERL